LSRHILIMAIGLVVNLVHIMTTHRSRSDHDDRWRTYDKIQTALWRSVLLQSGLWTQHLFGGPVFTMVGASPAGVESDVLTDDTITAIKLTLAAASSTMCPSIKTPIAVRTFRGSIYPTSAIIGSATTIGATTRPERNDNEWHKANDRDWERQIGYRLWACDEQ